MPKYVVELLMVFECDVDIQSTEVSGTYEECQTVINKATADIPPDGLRNQRVSVRLNKQQLN